MSTFWRQEKALGTCLNAWKGGLCFLSAAVFAFPEDRILSAPPEADSWNDIKRKSLFRIRIAAVGQALPKSILDATDEIASAIAREGDKNSGH